MQTLLSQMKKNEALLVRLIVLVIIELGLIFYSNSSLLFPPNFLLTLIAIGMLCALLTYSKYNRQREADPYAHTKWMYQALGQIMSGRKRDMYLLVYTIIHLAWIGDLLLSFGAGNVGMCLYQLLIFFLCWLNTCWYILESPAKPKISDEQRRLLVTPLSTIKFEIRDGELSSNIGSAFKCLDRYKQIEHVLILRSTILFDFESYCQKQDQLYSLFDQHDILGPVQDFVHAFESKREEQVLNTLRTLLCAYGSKVLHLSNFSHVEFQFTTPQDYSNHTACYNELQKCLQDSPYKDTQSVAVFNVTAGTSTVTTALAVLSLFEDRVMCFVDQNNSQDIIEVDPPVEVYNQLFDATSRKK